MSKQFKGILFIRCLFFLLFLTSLFVIASKPLNQTNLVIASCDRDRCDNDCGCGCDCDCPCPCHNCPTTTPTPINTPTPIPTLTPANTPTPTATNTPVPTPTLTNTPTPEPDNPVGGGEPDNPGPPVCNDPKPGTPTNLTATRIAPDQIRLDWNHAADPHTSYLVAYGPSLGNYPYGNPNIGNDNTYTISSLVPNTQYCFYVQAQNGCMPGDRSNEVCVNQPVGGQSDVLGASTDNYNPLVDGIRHSFGGQILGQSTDLVNTAEVKYSSQKLPSGNFVDNNHFISIPKIDLKEQIYIPQKIGDQLTVGQGEVLSDDNFYYGHNATDVFGSLYRLKSGDIINIDKDGKTQEYQIVTKLYVHQSLVDAINTDNPNQIVLMTCSYTRPDHRIILKANLTNL